MRASAGAQVGLRGGRARRARFALSAGARARACLALILGAALPGSARAQCPDGTPPPCGPARARPAPRPSSGSVAVLYFDNLSTERNHDLLTQAITEDVIARLFDVPGLTVKSSVAVRRYRDQKNLDPATVGRALGVAYLVTGSLQHGGGRFRVRAELARASTGERMWGEQYERDEGDALAITDDIATSIVTEVTRILLQAK